MTISNPNNRTRERFRQARAAAEAREERIKKYILWRILQFHRKKSA